MQPRSGYLAGLASRKYRSASVLLVIPFVLTGCFQHYFRTNTQTTVYPTMLDSLRSSNKYFIVHYSDNNIVGLNNVSVTNDRIEGNTVTLSGEHDKYLNSSSDSANRVKNRHKATALLEVHLYTVGSLNDSSRLSLPLSSFNRVDVYTFDAKKTTTNHVLSAVGIAATVAFIAAATSISGFDTQ